MKQDMKKHKKPLKTHQDHDAL